MCCGLAAHCGAGVAEEEEEGEGEGEAEGAAVAERDTGAAEGREEFQLIAETSD